MNSNEELRNYKHDIVGKFKDITSALSMLDSTAFDHPENHELFHAVHEVILKMVRTSRNTIAQNLKQDIVLLVSEKTPNLELPKLQIEGITLRHQLEPQKVTYYLYKSENAGDEGALIKALEAFLPFGRIETE